MSPPCMHPTVPAAVVGIGSIVTTVILQSQGQSAGKENMPFSVWASSGLRHVAVTCSAPFLRELCRPRVSNLVASLGPLEREGLSGATHEVHSH